MPGDFLPTVNYSEIRPARVMEMDTPSVPVGSQTTRAPAEQEAYNTARDFGDGRLDGDGRNAVDLTDHPAVHQTDVKPLSPVPQAPHVPVQHDAHDTALDMGDGTLDPDGENFRRISFATRTGGDGYVRVAEKPVGVEHSGK